MKSLLPLSKNSGPYANSKSDAMIESFKRINPTSKNESKNFQNTTLDMKPTRNKLFLSCQLG